MGLNVIAHRCRCHPSARLAHLAERLLGELMRAYGLPSLGLVERAPRLVGASLLVIAAVAGAFLTDPIDDSICASVIPREKSRCLI